MRVRSKDVQFSIIVPFKRWEEEVCLCVDSIIASIAMAPGCEIILVDNSGDQSVPDELRLLLDQKKVVLVEEKIPGAYRARNTGAKNAQGDVLIFCDSDCTVSKEWFRSVYEASSEHDIMQGNCFMKRTRTWFGHFLVEHYRRWNKISVEKHLLCAGVFAIRRSVFEDLGMFDETFLFSGDVAFADAIKKRSLAIEHVKDFTVFESARRSFRDVLIHFFRYGLGYSFYAKKNNIGFLNFFGYMAYKAGAGCFHILKGSLGFLMNGCKPRKSILKHVWQGGVDLVYSAGLLTGGLRYGWRGQYKRGAAYI